MSNNVAVFTTRDASRIVLTNSTLNRSTTIDTGPSTPTEFVPAD